MSKIGHFAYIDLDRVYRRVYDEKELEVSAQAPDSI
jgi:hypothetical protein